MPVFGITGNYTKTKSYTFDFCRNTQNTFTSLGIIKCVNLKVIKTSTYAVGEMGDDNQTRILIMICLARLCLKVMELSYAPVDGEFKNQKGDLINKVNKNLA